MNEVMMRIDQIAGMGISFIGNMTILVITIVIGLIIGLFGLKLVRLWAAFIGFILGMAAGGGIGYAAGLADVALAGAALGGAIVLAVLFCIFCKVGIFFFMMFLVSGACLLFTQADSLPMIGISFAVGIVISVITMKIFDPMVIIITSIEGGFMAGNAAVALVGLDGNIIAGIVVPVVLTVICACVQFVMRSRQVGKKQARKADEHRQQASRETEVEQARMLLHDDAELDEDVDGDEAFLDEEDYDEVDEEFLDDDLDEMYLDDDLENDEDFKIIE